MWSAFFVWPFLSEKTPKNVEPKRINPSFFLTFAKDKKTQL